MALRRYPLWSGYRAVRDTSVRLLDPVLAAATTQCPAAPALGRARFRCCIRFNCCHCGLGLSAGDERVRGILNEGKLIISPQLRYLAVRLHHRRLQAQVSISPMRDDWWRFGYVEQHERRILSDTDTVSGFRKRQFGAGNRGEVETHRTAMRELSPSEHEFSGIHDCLRVQVCDLVL